MSEAEQEVVLQNGSDEEFEAVCKATLETFKELDHATAAMRARESDLLNMRFTV